MYQTYRSYGSVPMAGRSGCAGRLVVALLLALLAIGGYTFGTLREQNPVTGEVQRVGMSTQDEIMMGLQAAPEMVDQFGGLFPDEGTQRAANKVGQTVVIRSDAKETPYTFNFRVLADPNTINAFALPGGQVFITVALLRQLQTEGQLAGVLAHEVGHVVARHAAERVAKVELLQGLTGAAVVATYDPQNPSSVQQAQMAQLVGELVTMKYSRDDELESDRLAVRLMGAAGYDPRALIEVMHILANSEAGGPPEFFSTHPNPGNRITRIEQAIAEEYPNGVPEGLIP